MYSYIFVFINIYILAKFPPSAGFPSPSGGVAPLAPPLGAFGAPVGAPAAPIWVTAAFGCGERKDTKINIKNLGRPERTIFGAPGAPRSGRQLTPP